MPDENGNPTPGGSGWYRCHVPAQALERNGHRTVVGTLVADRAKGVLGVRTWDGEHHFGLDVVVLQRYMLAWVVNDVLMARANGQIVLNDVDDWWEGLHPAHRAFAITAADPMNSRTTYRQVLAVGDGIVCSTPFLAAQYRKLGKTWLVRNGIDAFRWPITHPKYRPPVLGWVGVIPLRSSGDLEVLRGFLGPFCVEHGLKVVHSGALEGYEPNFARTTWLDRYGVEVEERPMLPAHEIPRLWDGIDIALIPLSSMAFSSKAKSCIAGMSAAARGIPFIASPADEYEWLRKAPLAIGRTAKNGASWRKHLTELLDFHTRAEEGKGNRRRLILALTPERMAGEWEEVLRSVNRY